MKDDCLFNKTLYDGIFMQMRNDDALEFLDQNIEYWKAMGYLFITHTLYITVAIVPWYLR